jgi:hypothetical protein
MHHHSQPDSPMAPESFPTDPTGLLEVGRPALLELGDGDTLELRVGPVAKRLGDTVVRMLGYNGSIPGPPSRSPRAARSSSTSPTRGTWPPPHGLRLENRYDGVPTRPRAPIPVGGEFSYRIQLPDGGLYWYHPHIREDYTQELGLSGNLLVVPADPDYWPPVDRELVLTVDDLLVEEGRIAPFSPVETSYAAMGRFGNVFLVGGEPDPVLEAGAGEVVRLWLTNTANTRVFNVAVPGARLKLVGGDSGRVEHQEFVESVVLAPSERAVVDVLVGRPGGAAPGAPHPGPGRPAGHRGRDHRPGGVAGGPGVRAAAAGAGAGGRTPGSGPVAGRLPGQGAGPGRPAGRPGGPAGGRRAGRLCLPDASRGDQRGARALSQMRHEAARHPGPCRQSDQLCLPDASGGHQSGARALSQVWDEAARGLIRPQAGGR